MRYSEEIDIEFRKKFNPEGSNLRTAQYRMLNMLLWVDSVMKKNKIPYALTAGTLLGAVRHKGFIPWDDDVDIMIPQKFYHKMKKAFLQEKHPQYVIQCDETDRFSFKCWCTIRDKKSKYIHSNSYYKECEKVMKYTGLQIDLFPIDNHIEKHINHILSWCSWGNKFYYFTRNKWIAITMHKLQSLLCNLFQRITPTQHVWSYGYGVTGQRYEYKENILFPLSTTKFEGYTFPAPHNIEAFLKAHFGEYMEVPDLSTFNKHSISNYEIW